MPFRNLQRANRDEDDADDGAPRELETPVSKFDDRIELLKAIMPPAERDDQPTVNVDPVQFPTEFSRERVMEKFRFEYPDVEFSIREVRISELEHWSFTRFASAEDVFRRRGYISNVEIGGFTQGERAPETTHLARNRSAACHQLTLIANFSQTYKPAAKSWKPPANGAGDAAAQSFLRLETSLRNFIGEKQRHSFPLVRRDDVFLPCRRFEPDGDVIYLTTPGVLESSIADGRNDPYRLSSGLPGEIADQVRFEYRNSTHLFQAATPEALLLWQTQALAYLRVAAWNVEFYSGKKLHDVVANSRTLLQQERLLKAKKGGVRRGELDVDDIARLGLPEATALRDIADKLIFDLRESIPVPLGTRCLYGLTEDEHFVAALHGSTYAPLSTPKPMSEQDLKYYYLQDPLNFILPIASWMGELKRHRRAVLDREMAKRLREIPLDSEDLGLLQFAPIISDRLSESAWAVLVEACDELLADETSRPIEIVYNWTRDMAQPWGAERVAIDAIRIRGPLLDFPISKTKLWNEKAVTLWVPERQTFEHGARRPLPAAI